jgi:hypothetical protein
MQTDDVQPQFVNSGIAIRCDPNDTTGTNPFEPTPLTVKRKTANPFAKRGQSLSELGTNGRGGSTTTTDFVRSSILPAPRRRIALTTGENGSNTKHESPAAVEVLKPAFQEQIVDPVSTLEKRLDRKWRLLWRGGLEVGAEGYKLEGKFSSLCRYRMPHTQGERWFEPVRRDRLYRSTFVLPG